MMPRQSTQACEGRSRGSYFVTPRPGYSENPVQHHALFIDFAGGLLEPRGSYLYFEDEPGRRTDEK
jgi:hypothetical protein